MITALFALMTCASAWMAWRHHPLYSTRSTLRVGGEILLLIAASMCVIYETTLFIQGRSPAVQMTSLGAVIVLLALGMIFAIGAISTPASAKLHTQLPPQTALVNLHRRAVTHWAKVAAVFMGVCGALAFVPGPVRYIAGSAALIAGLLACVMLPVGYVMARRMDRAVTALELHPWLHWQYPPAAWAAWSATQVGRLKAEPATFILKRNWRRLAMLCGVMLVGSLALVPGSLVERTGWALSCCALLLLIVEASAWDARRAPQRLSRRLRDTTPDSYFGQDGLVCNGKFFPWLDQSVYLTSATLDTRLPRSLPFSLEKIVPSAYGSPGVVHVRQSVLIPPDAPASDLEQLQAALSARCPAAKVLLT